MEIQLGGNTITLRNIEINLLSAFAASKCSGGRDTIYFTQDYNGDIGAFNIKPEPEFTNGGYWLTTNHSSKTRCVRSSRDNSTVDNWQDCITEVSARAFLGDDGWFYPEDGVYPEHGQHVIVWDLRDNVYSGNGDNNKGQVQGGDCFFIDKKVEWDSRPLSERMRWNDNFEEYASMNGGRYIWNGQGPCTFNEVVAWRPFPSKPPRIGA